MARRRKESEDSASGLGGLGKFFAVAAGMAAGAALAYGAKKIADYIEEEEKVKSKQTNEWTDNDCARPTSYVDDDDKNDKEDDSESSDEDLSQYGAAAQPHRRPQSDGNPQRLKGETLHQKLDYYYKSYTCIPMHHSQVACTVVEDVKYVFEKHLAAKFKMPIKNMFNYGSCTHNLQVVRPLTFDVMVPIELKDSDWECLDGEQSVMKQKGYWLLKQAESTNLDSDVETYITGDYLSPTKINEAFHSIASQITHDYTNYKISVIGSEDSCITLQCEYSIQKKVIINFLPTVNINDTWLTARLHPDRQFLHSAGNENLWRKEFLAEEDEKVESLFLGQGCQLECLKILLAIRLNHAQLNFLPPRALKHLLFNLLDQEDEWAVAFLSERFLDLLKALEFALESGDLPNYFEPKEQMLTKVKKDNLEIAKNFIRKVIGENDYDSLLMMEY